MCGIAGYLGSAADPGALVGRMVDALGHRGPDGRRVELPMGQEGCIALGNTRLAIIDLSESVRMPMEDPETGNWIAYNGEVYNFPTLRTELESAGYRFRTGTDTEVILKAYARWGLECLHHLRGMFALAIWDSPAGELVLARDRLGLKPLYFYQHPDGLLFASEVRALLATGLVPRRLDPKGLHTYLWNGSAWLPTHWWRGFAHCSRVTGCASGRTGRSWRPNDTGPSRSRRGARKCASRNSKRSGHCCARRFAYGSSAMSPWAHSFPADSTPPPSWR